MDMILGRKDEISLAEVFIGRLFLHKTIYPPGNFHSVEKVAVYCLC